MGNSEAKKTNPTDLTVAHPRFQSSKAYTVADQRVMETFMGGIEKKQYENWQERVKDTKLPENQEFILMPTEHKFSTEGLCGTSGIATMTYPDYPHLLIDEIQERRATRKYFEEDELWYLLYSLASSKKTLNGKIGDVRPHNVFINQQGKVKIGSSLSWPKEPTNYAKAFENISTYLAPQEVRVLGSAPIVENPEAEIFSIGQTLLSVAILEDLSGLADIKQHTFNEAELQQNLDQLKISPYSDILKSTIVNMCDVTPSQRLTSEQLWALLEPHQEKIKARENFVISNAPEKLHWQVGEVRKSIPILLSSMKKTFESHPPSLNSGLPIQRVTLPGTTYSNLNGPEKMTIPFHQTTQAESVYVPHPFYPQNNQSNEIIQAEKKEDVQN